MKHNINEVTSAEFRTKIKSLGFKEKGSELTSGGEVNSNFLDILMNLVSEWKTIGGDNCPLTFTSGNDRFHKNITSYTSRHTKGEAVDVTLHNGCHSKFIALLKSYKSKYNGFSYIDEYRNPTSKATGGHFHMSFRAGQPEGGGKSSSNEPQLSTTGETDTTITTDGSTSTENNAGQKLVQKLNQIDSERISKMLPTQTSGITESLLRGDSVGVFKVISDVKGHGGRKLGNWQSDNAWDLKAPIGTPVYSYTDGVVSKVHESKPGSNKIFGTQISIKGKNGYPNIFYTHLEGSTLQKGQEVKVGDLIGKIKRWEAHPESSHVHIGLDGGHDLKDLIDKNPKIFNTTSTSTNDLTTNTSNTNTTSNNTTTADSASKSLIDKLKKIDLDFVKKIIPSLSESATLTSTGDFIYPIESEIKRKKSKKITFKGLYGLKVVSPYKGVIMSDDKTKITIRHLYKSKYYYSEIEGVDKVVVPKGRTVTQGETIGYSGNESLIFTINNENGLDLSLEKFFPESEKKDVNKINTNDVPSSRAAKAISDLFSGVVASPFDLASKSLNINQEKDDKLNEQINRIKKLL